MSESTCGVSSCGNNSGGITDNYRMAGSSGSCSFIKQERIDGENFTGDSRSNVNLEMNRHTEDHKDDASNERAGKSPRSSPTYPKLNGKNGGQLLHQQPDSQSSNNNNSIKAGKFNNFKYLVKI
jgi:hypothetical protein